MGLKLQKDFYINFPPEIFERIYKYYRSIYANSKNIPDHWASRYDEKMESFDFSSGKSIKYRRLNNNNGLDDYYPANFGKGAKISLLSSIKRRLLRRIDRVDNKALDPIRNYQISKYKDLPLSLETIKNIPLNNPSWVQARSVLIANMIYPFIKDLKKPKVLEIGPGSGNLMYCIDKFFNQSQIFLVDLPSSLLFSIVNLLSKENPLDCKFILPNELYEGIDFSNYKYVFLKDDQINLVKNNSIDLMGNTVSFAEMMPDTINNYFQNLRRVAKKINYFYCLNRVEKNMTKDGNKYPNRFHQYPWICSDKEFFFRLSEIETIETTQSAMFEKLVRLSKLQ